jgi:ABC-type multidrug transport system ATPase subunit
VGSQGFVFNAADGWLLPAKPFPPAALQLQDVAKQGRLGPLSLEIPAGEFLAIVGPSGAGKSSLLKAIVDLPGSYDSGTVAIVPQSATGDPPTIGYVAQQNVLYPDLTVLQTLRYAAQLRGRAASDSELRQLLMRLDVPVRCFDTCI